LDQEPDRGGVCTSHGFYQELIDSLVEFAEHEFELNQVDQNGIALRDHLEQVERQTGVRPKELDGPEFPYLLEYIWSAFLSLNSLRTVGMNGPNPISLVEIKYWSELTENPLSAFDVELIKRLDNAYIRTYHANSK